MRCDVRVLTLRPLIFNFLSDSSRSLHSRLCPIPNFLKVAHPAPASIPDTAIVSSFVFRHQFAVSVAVCRRFTVFATEMGFWWP